MTRVKLDIDNRTIVRVMLVAAAFWLAIGILVEIKTALVWLLISFFLAMALNRPVSYLAGRIPGGSRALATGISYVVVLGILGLFLYSTVPTIVSETRKLIQTIPERVEDLRSSSRDGFIADIIDKYSLENEAQELAGNLTNKIGDVGGPVISGIGTVTNSLVAFITILVLTFFMLIEGPQWLELFWSYHPKERRKHHQEQANKMYNVVTGYVNGQLLIASIAGLVSLVAMVIVGIPNPIALAGVISMTGLLPLIGAILGAVIIVTVALFQSITQALLMLAFFIVYQQIENNAIQPYVQSRTLEISPLLVLFSVIVGVQVGGLLGGFLAIPTAASLRILALDFAKQRDLINS